MELQGRLIWRRLAALFVDYVVALIFTTIVIAPLVIGNSDRIRLTTSGLNFTKCWTSNTAPQDLVDKAGGVVVDRLLICDKTMLGLYNGRWATLESTTSKPGDKYRTTRRITVPINQKGNPVQPWLLHDALIIVVYLVLTPLILTRWSGQMPGRRLLKVRVYAQAPSFATFLKRECLKWGPFILTVLICYNLVPQTLAEANSGNLISMVSLALAPALVGALWWGAPLIYWRGSMPYDRICGTLVVHSPAKLT